MPGVFVIGTKSVEAETRLAAIQDEGGERALAVLALKRPRISLADLRGNEAAAKKEYLEMAWGHLKKFLDANPALEAAFSGTGGVANSKQNPVDALFAQDTTDEDLPELDALNSQAASVFADTPAVEALREIPAFNFASHTGSALVG